MMFCAASLIKETNANRDAKALADLSANATVSVRGVDR
jgi:hypothetical protein